MFRRIITGKSGSGFHVFYLNQEYAVFQHFAERPLTGQRFRLTVDFFFHISQEFFIRRNQNCMFQSAAVFCLRKDIRRSEGNVSFSIGKNHNFGGARNHINGTLTVDQFFCSCNICVTGSGNDFCFLNRFCSECQCCDSICSTKFINFGCSGKIQCVKCARVDFSVFHRRSHCHDRFYTGSFRNTDRMDCGGNKRGGSAGNVTGGAFHGLIHFPESDTGAHLFFPGFRDCHFCKRADIFQCKFDCLFLTCGDQFFCFCDFFGGDKIPVRSHIHIVKSFNEFTNGSIAAFFDLLYDFSDSRFNMGRTCGAFTQRLQFGIIVLIVQ